MAILTGFRVAVLATDGFEESELTLPVAALREAGATVKVLSPQGGQLQALRHMEKGISLPTDGRIADADPNEFDGVLLPGGALNADALRVMPEVRSFLRSMQDTVKPLAAICHAPWELISAGLVGGRFLTSYYTIQDDVRNAGGNWVDERVAEDDNWVTSRQPDDIPDFNRAMIDVFSRRLTASRR